jgi:Fe-S oxidoreductase
MGWLPLSASLAAAVPGAVNRAVHRPTIARLAKAVAGIDERRDIPWFARETLQQWFARRPPQDRPRETRGEVLLWPDTFTNHFHPSIGRAAVELIEAAGWQVTMPTRRVCCGLTWISTGQLKTAKKVLRRTVRELAPHVRNGGMVLGLEPSCTAVFRSDAAELLPGDHDVLRLRQQTVTLAELLHDCTPGWQPPKLHRRVVVQTHCHHHAIMKFDTDRALLEATGADVEVLDSGCCGLAGNFGFERGHYDVSIACAERVLLPAVRDSDPADVILADGFSCRTQIHQGSSGGREAMHLAELLAGAQGSLAGDHAWPEQRWTERPERRAEAPRGADTR